MKKFIKYIKKIIKYISRLFIGFISVYFGFITFIAFKLDVLHAYDDDDYFCLFPPFDFCLLIFAISLAFLFLVWYITYEW